MNLLTVIGARPQFIKAATVSRRIATYASIKEHIVHTGQHFDSNMSDVFFDEMNIPKPAYFLNIHSLSHATMTGRMLEGLGDIMAEIKPDAVLVYGDTNSTLAAALAASKLCIPVLHVEAGLRSFNMNMPEEINRVITDRISSVLYCPTQVAVHNLTQEGFENYDAEIILSGDVMEDAALYYSNESNISSQILQLHNIEVNKYILCTIHRQENTDDVNQMTKLISALNKLNVDIPIIIPIHPRTLKKIELYGLKLNARIIPPVGYLDMIQLIKNSALVVTDSGGLQKEAYFFNKFCVTLREETEWTELVEGGYNVLAGTSEQKILKSTHLFLNREFVKQESFYGGGKAADIICKHIVEKFSL